MALKWFIGGVVVAVALVSWAFAPRYTLVATTTLNIGGAYKLDTWTGKIWLCEPTAILIDNKTVVAPKGCHEIEETKGDGSLANSI
jgi:hypothetical protein